MSDENKLKVLTAKKETLFMRIQRLYDSGKKIKDKEHLNYFKIRYEALEDTKKEFEEIIERINEINLRLDPDYVINFAPLEAVDELYCAIKKVAKDVFKKDSESQKPPSSQSGSTSQKPSIRLPKIELPTFTGIHSEWPVFYETFKSLIHENSEVDDINNLHYLLGKLGGKALATCSGVTPTADNYKVIWDTLVKKYDDKRAIANCYMDQIMNFKPAQTENVHCLNAFLEKFDAAVKALKILNIADLSDFMLSYLALSKIDKDTSKPFEMSRRSNDQPTYDEVLKFIQEQCKILSLNDKLNKSNTSQARQKAHTGSNIQSTRTFMLNNNSGANNHESNSCPFCNKNHALFACDKFIKISPKERFSFAKENSLCYNCLSSMHRINNCKSKNTCRTCASRHHSLLHFTPTTSPALSHPDASEPTQSNTNTFCSTSQDNGSLVLLSTAIVHLVLPSGKGHNIRVLIDNASQSNFLTLKCSKRLKLPVTECASSVSGMGTFPQKISGRTKLVITSRFNTCIKFSLEAFIVDKITGKMPSLQTDTSSFEFLKDLPIADETFAIPGEIDGILGAEIYAKIIGPNKLSAPSGNLYAIETSLGYVITGSTPILNANCNTHSFCSFVESVDEVVKRFWELENIPNTPCLTQEEVECEQLFTSTYKRDISGRYTVHLPFKDNPQLLGDSYAIASRRFFALERRFNIDPHFKNSYCNAIQEQIDHGYMSQVFEKEPPNPVYYIPHHAVAKPESVSTPLRVVLDGSAKTSNGISLNDILHKGPNLQTDLMTILMNFRLFEIAMTADLKKMFLQILVAPQDRKFQRLLWRSSPNDPLGVFQFNRVAFGLRCSPYLALRTVRQLALDEFENYSAASTTVLRDTYMDDLVTSVNDFSQAKDLYAQLIQIFKTGGFDLLKWDSNSQELLQTIPEEHRRSKTLEFEESTSKVLGLEWHSFGDFFSFKVIVPAVICSKRNALSTIARIYDPLGFLSPVTFYAKLLIREFWQLKIDWDDDPPSHIRLSWTLFYEELHALSEVHISRHLFAQEGAHTQLLGFADASEKGYGAVVYMRVTLPNGEVKTALVCSKSKVAPLKTISIPRLELCAALLLAQLLRLIMDTFSPRLTINSVYAFSDSMVALHWIHGSPSRWKSFVSARVVKIQNLIASSHWFHIAGSDNPADCLSRGLTPLQFVRHPHWLGGPEWIKISIHSWPINPFTPDANLTLEEKSKNFCALAQTSENDVILELTNRVSDWKKLLVVIIFVLRFAKLLPKRSSISSSDLEEAELFLWRKVQRSCFEREFKLLENDHCNASWRNLRPFINNGLIRVGGRLSNSNLDYDQQHPILLPKSHVTINMLIDYYHRKNMHTGPHLLLSLLRQKYWILSARNIVRKRIRKCNLCFRSRPHRPFPLMGDLPAPRVTEAKAFCHTGVDYGGPYSITLSRRRGLRTQKAYICLFICFATRALHLEVASDLSTDTFLAAFKRFLARRGPCSVMYSDQGTNFQGAKTALHSVYSFVQSDQFTTALQRELTNNRIEWKFNPPSAPHMGGIWEAGIKAVKSHLTKVIGLQILSYEEFATVLAQIECLLNSRPLCWLSTDPSEPLPLTPAHFLTLTPLQSLPAQDVTNTPTNRLSRKELLDQLVQSYWKRWRLEYLNTLQVRQKWNTPSFPVTPGTLVLLQLDNSPPLHWPCGVIQEVFPGKDGISRVATVKTKDGIYKRPVVKLYPLPSQ